MNKSELLDQIADEWRALRRAFHDLDEAELVRPGPEGWSVKDHVAHVRAWERVALVRDIEGRSFAEAAEMDAATSAATEGMTAEGGLNDYFVERDRALPLEAVLEASSALHAELVAALEVLPEERRMMARSHRASPRTRTSTTRSTARSSRRYAGPRDAGSEVRSIDERPRTGATRGRLHPNHRGS